MALNSRMRLRRSASSSVVWVRSPVKTMKSGCCGSALTACTACRSVSAASGFGGPLKPQCVSESWTKKKSSSPPPDFRVSLVHAPARPEAKTTPPKPSSWMNSRRPFGSFMGSSLRAPRLDGSGVYSLRFQRWARASSTNFCSSASFTSETAQYCMPSFAQLYALYPCSDVRRSGSSPPRLLGQMNKLIVC